MSIQVGRKHFCVLIGVLLCFCRTDQSGVIKFRCPPNSRICICSEKGKTEPSIADCTNKNLSTIPRFSQHYEKFIFSKNNLNALKQSTFSTIANSGLLELVIRDCRIRNVTRNTFQKLRSLHTLDISYNAEISLKELWSSLETLNITSLDLSGIPMKKAVDFLFNNSLLRNLQILALRFCSLVKLEPFRFERFYRLEELDISHNNFESRSLNLSFFISLETLTAINCNLTKVPLPTKISKLKKLNISNNRIRKFDEFIKSGHLLSKLTDLTLDSNPIQILIPTAFSNLTSIQKISLINIRTESLIFHGIDSGSLIALDIGNSTFMKKSHPNVFQLSVNIQNLNMNGVNLNGWADVELCTMFEPLCKSMRRLYLQNTMLNALPKSAFRCFTRLQLLDLSHNKITGWDKETFWNVTVRKIKLDNNRIEVLNATSFPPKIWENISILEVQNNPFACTCDMHWFRQWMKGQYYKLGGNYGRKYNCYSPVELEGTKLVDYDPSFEDCFPLDISMILAIAVCVICLLVTLFLNCFVQTNFDFNGSIKRDDKK